MKFKVTITEHLSKDIFVDAENEADAIYIVEAGYYNGMYFLDEVDDATAEFTATESEV